MPTHSLDKPRHYLFTVSKYHRMAESGIFTEADRMELIEGRVIARSRIASHHAACVKILRDVLGRILADTDTIIGVQNPVRLSDYSEPQPDISILKRHDDYYSSGHPVPADILLLVEVADATLLYDRNTKLPLYARSSIREVWLVDLVNHVIERHSDPAAGRYQQVSHYERGSRVISAQLPRIQMSVSDVLRG